MAYFLLFLSSLAGSGQSGPARTAESVDTAITVTGRDETVMPLPLPWRQQAVAVPDFSPWQPPSLAVPAIKPPSDDWSGRTMRPSDLLQEIGS